MDIGISHFPVRQFIRRGLQSAGAAVAAFITVQAVGTGEAYLAVISAVLVLQRDRDQTFASARSRILAALIGTLVGGLALAVTPQIATPFSLALVMLIMGGLIAWKPEWRYGMVAAAALAVGSEAGLWETARNRGIAIALGVLMGIAAGFLIWPASAKAATKAKLQQALSACGDLLQGIVAKALGEAEPPIMKLHATFQEAIAAAGDSAESLHLARASEKQCLQEAVHRAERLWHALIILDRVTETQQQSRPELPEGGLDKVQEIRSALCNGVASVARFEEVPAEEFDRLESACRDLWLSARIDPEEEDGLEKLALVYGLREASRNLKDISDLLPSLNGR